MHKTLKIVALASLTPFSLQAFEATSQEKPSFVLPVRHITPFEQDSLKQDTLTLAMPTGTLQARQKENSPLTFTFHQQGDTLTLPNHELPSVLRGMTRLGHLTHFLKVGNSLEWKGRLKAHLSLKGGAPNDTIFSFEINLGDVIRIFVPLSLAYGVNAFVVHPYVIKPVIKKIDKFSLAPWPKKSLKLALHGANMAMDIMVCMFLILHFPEFTQVCEKSLVPSTFEKLLAKDWEEYEKLDPLYSTLRTFPELVKQFGQGLANALQNLNKQAIDSYSKHLNTPGNVLITPMNTLKDNLSVLENFFRGAFSKQYLTAGNIINNWSHLFLPSAESLAAKFSEILQQKKTEYIHNNISLRNLLWHWHFPEIFQIASVDKTVNNALVHAGQVIISATAGTIVSIFVQKPPLTEKANRAKKVVIDMFKEYIPEHESWDAFKERAARATGLVLESAEKMVKELRKKYPTGISPQDPGSLSISQISFEKEEGDTSKKEASVRGILEYDASLDASSIIKKNSLYASSIVKKDEPISEESSFSDILGTKNASPKEEEPNMLSKLLEQYHLSQKTREPENGAPLQNEEEEQESLLRKKEQ